MCQNQHFHHQPPTVTHYYLFIWTCQSSRVRYWYLDGEILNGKLGKRISSSISRTTISSSRNAHQMMFTISLCCVLIVKCHVLLYCCDLIFICARGPARSDMIHTCLRLYQRCCCCWNPAGTGHYYTHQ